MGVPGFQGTLVDVHPRVKITEKDGRSAWLEVKIEAPLNTHLSTELTKELGNRVQVTIEPAQQSMGLGDKDKG